MLYKIEILRAMTQFFVTIFLLLLTLTAFAESPEQMKKSEEDIRADMIKISRQLGVTCNECHNLKNYKSNEKPSFGISLQHLKATELLKQNGFSGKNTEPEASCYMCHQGQRKISFKEKLSDHFRGEPKKAKVETKVELTPEKE